MRITKAWKAIAKEQGLGDTVCTPTGTANTLLGEAVRLEEIKLAKKQKTKSN